jgi:ketosteroid isomerase-like protein
MLNGRIRRCCVSIALALAACGGAPTPDPDFEETLAAHIQAIQNRDLAALEATITAGDELILIFPGGQRTTTREEYMAFHREWFASDTWTMNFERLGVVEGRDFAIAMVRTVYEDVRDGERVQSQSWLTLTFRKENGRWALYHDQNTRIP